MVASNIEGALAELEAQACAESHHRRLCDASILRAGQRLAQAQIGFAAARLAARLGLSDQSNPAERGTSANDLSEVITVAPRLAIHVQG